MTLIDAVVTRFGGSVVAGDDVLQSRTAFRIAWAHGLWPRMEQHLDTTGMLDRGDEWVSCWIMVWAVAASPPSMGSGADHFLMCEVQPGRPQRRSPRPGPETLVRRDAVVLAIPVFGWPHGAFVFLKGGR